MPPDKYEELKRRIDLLERKEADDIRTHSHDGLASVAIDWTTDINGLLETVSAVPAGIPKSPYDQVKIYVNGATLRLYWYDSVAHVWHYVTATA